MAFYEIYLGDQLGNRFIQLDSITDLRWGRVVNNVGYCTLTIAKHLWKNEWFSKDNRIEIWRGKDSISKPRLETVCFMRKIRRRHDGAMDTVAIKALDPVYLLTSRNIRDAGRKTGAIDDSMKEYVTSELGSGAGTGRDMTSYGFSVEAEVSLGPSDTIRLRGRELLKGLQEASLVARQAGTPIYFDVVPPTPSTLEFQTYKTLRGADRSFSASNNPHIVSVENESLRNPVLEFDYEHEVTFVYGNGKATATVTSSDTTRINESVWSRREIEVLNKSAHTTANIQSITDAHLRAGLPTISFGGELVEAPGFIYGVDWELGDKVTASYGGIQLDVQIRGTDFTLDEQGLETVTGKLAYESA